jgi:hypothetical protein
MVASFTIVTVVEQLAQLFRLFDLLLHKYDFDYHTIMDCLLRFSDLTFHGPTFTGASFGTTSEV